MGLFVKLLTLKLIDNFLSIKIERIFVKYLSLNLIDNIFTKIQKKRYESVLDPYPYRLLI